MRRCEMSDLPRLLDFYRLVAVHILAVNPRCQGCGYARAMMREMIDVAKDMGNAAEAFPIGRKRGRMPV